MRFGKTQQVSKTRKKTAIEEIPPFSASTSPPGRGKLASALRTLLKSKDFGSITTSEIAQESGVNESLIYRYFGNKRGLLHGVVSDDLQRFIDEVMVDLNGVLLASEKLRRVVWNTINFYKQDRIFARILLLEVRSHKNYFKSKTYRTVKIYSQLIIDIIQEGIDSGELKSDISPQLLRQILLGSIEHLIMPAIIHNGPIDVDQLQEACTCSLFSGIVKT